MFRFVGELYWSTVKWYSYGRSCTATLELIKRKSLNEQLTNRWIWSCKRMGLLCFEFVKDKVIVTKMKYLTELRRWIRSAFDSAQIKCTTKFLISDWVSYLPNLLRSSRWNTMMESYLRELKKILISVLNSNECFLIVIVLSIQFTVAERCAVFIESHYITVALHVVGLQ